MTVAEVRNGSSEVSRESDQLLILMVQPLGGKRGPARTLQEFATHLASYRDIAVAIPDGLVSRLLAEHPRIRVVRLPILATRAASWRKGAGVLLSEFAGGDQPLLIHANGVSGLNLVAPLALRTRAPTLVHFHDYEVSRRMRLHLYTWKRLGVRMRFFPVSEYSRGLLQMTAVGDLVTDVLPNPVRTPPPPTEWHPHRPFRISFVGSNDPRKGLHILVRIAERLRDEDVEWHLFGADPDRSQYVRECVSGLERASLASKVRWRGVVDDPSPAYDECDALFIPSLRESFGRVAVEGMAHGIPILAARVSGISELFVDGLNGLLFDIDRPEQAEAILRRLIHEPELGKKLARAEAEAARQFEVSAVGQRLEQHYEEMLSLWPTERTVS